MGGFLASVVYAVRHWKNPAVATIDIIITLLFVWLISPACFIIGFIGLPYLTFAAMDKYANAKKTPEGFR